MTYKTFIQNIISTRGQWNIPAGEYFEAHHIIPRCLGGDGDIRKGRQYIQHSNIIWLYAEEHFIAHKLLAIESNNPKLIFAWSMMAFPKGKARRDIEISPEDYALLKKMQSDILKNNNTFLKNGHPWNYGLTKDTDIRVKKYSDLSKQTKIQKKVLSDKQLTRIKLINDIIDNNGLECFILNSQYNTNGTAVSNNKYVFYFRFSCDTSKIILPDGFYFGNIATSGKHDMSHHTDEMRKHRTKISSGSNNNMYGKGYKISGGNNGHATIRYFFNNNIFECRDDLVYYLKNNGWSQISESAIRKIIDNNYGVRTIKKFKYIIDNLKWEKK